MKLPTLSCSLCKATTIPFYTSLQRPNKRSFYSCKKCYLISTHPDFFLSKSEEKQRYLSHQNDINDPKYREFLSQLFVPLREVLKKGACGLDYGCGPGPALATMLEEAGYKTETFDPFFCPNHTSLERSYDFITCTETVEHFHHPAVEFTRFNQLLNPGGWLGILTGMVEERDLFPDWYYHNDPTHVCFYTLKTMRHIANQFKWQAFFPSKNIVLFKKQIG